MAISDSVVIYTRSGAYEPGCRYYFDANPLPTMQEFAEALAAAQARLIPTAINIVRWEQINSLEVKVNEGTLAQAGLFAGEYSEFKFAAYIRFNTSGPERPSSKYVHPLPEGALTNGVPQAGWLTAVGNYGTDLIALGVTDSDGHNVTSVAFRHGTRRKKVRIAP